MFPLSYIWYFFFFAVLGALRHNIPWRDMTCHAMVWMKWHGLWPFIFAGNQALVVQLMGADACSPADGTLQVPPRQYKHIQISYAWHLTWNVRRSAAALYDFPFACNATCAKRLINWLIKAIRETSCRQFPPLAGDDGMWSCARCRKSI